MLGHFSPDTGPNILSAACIGETGGISKPTGNLDSLPLSSQGIGQLTALLRLLLSDFIRSFDVLTDHKTLIKLWSRAASLSGGYSSPFYISGRVTALCIRQPDGERLYSGPQGPTEIEILGCKCPESDGEGTAFYRVDSSTLR